MPPATPDPVVDVLRDQLEALEAMRQDLGRAHEERTEARQDSKEAHRDTREAVARLDGRLATQESALTASRLEVATAMAGSAAAVEVLKEQNAMLRNLIYTGAAVLVALTGSLLWATLFLRGIDADAAIRAGHSFVTPSTGVPDAP